MLMLPSQLIYYSRIFSTSPPSCESDSDISQQEMSTTGYQAVGFDVSTKFEEIKNVCLVVEFPGKEETALTTTILFFIYVSPLCVGKNWL